MPHHKSPFQDGLFTLIEVPSMEMQIHDLTELDAGLDPRQDPGWGKGMRKGLTPGNLLAEEMEERGLPPIQPPIKDEASLEARRLYMTGHLASLAEMVKIAQGLICG